MAVIWDKNIKELEGEVVSAVNDKTIVVKVERIKEHPLYGKRHAVSKKFHAHDENNTANKWDVVLIRSANPISKKKRWNLVEVVRTAETV